MAATANNDHQWRTTLILYVQIRIGVYPTKLLRISSTLFAPSELFLSSSWHVQILQQKGEKDTEKQDMNNPGSPGLPFFFFLKKNPIALVWLFAFSRARMRAFSNAVFPQEARPRLSFRMNRVSVSRPVLVNVTEQPHLAPCCDCPSSITLPPTSRLLCRLCLRHN